MREILTSISNTLRMNGIQNELYASGRAIKLLVDDHKYKIRVRLVNKVNIELSVGDRGYGMKIFQYDYSFDAAVVEYIINVVNNMRALRGM